MHGDCANIPERWHARLENWALWKVSGQARTGGFSDVYRSGSAWEWWRHPPSKPKPLVGPAIDTDRLIQALPTDEHGHHVYREAIEVVYLWTYPESLEARAASLSPPIHRTTLTRRLERACDHLEELQGERERAAVRRLRMVQA